jgi:hypothetical protein
MVNIAEVVCLESKTASGNMTLSRMECMTSDMPTQLNDIVQTFAYFYEAMDDNY